jgi:hypothetical protein
MSGGGGQESVAFMSRARGPFTETIRALAVQWLRLRGRMVLQNAFCMPKTGLLLVSASLIVFISLHVRYRI